MEFWLLLQNLLYLLEPKTILELGSGRSTYYFADFVKYRGAAFLSVEQSASFARRMDLGLRLALLPGGLVKRVPVKDGWYCLDKLRGCVDKALPGGLEFLFIDGPEGPDGLRRTPTPRSAPQFFDFLAPRIAPVKCILVDDVHIPEVLAVSRQLARDHGYRLVRMKKIEPRREQAFLLKPGACGALKKFPGYLSKLVYNDKG